MNKSPSSQASTTRADAASLARPGPRRDRSPVFVDGDPDLPEWVVLPSWRRIHAARQIDATRQGFEDNAGAEGTTACGRWGWLTLPGIFTRMGAPRCAHCCDATGIPRGAGHPKNDAECRRILGYPCQAWGPDGAAGPWCDLRSGHDGRHSFEA